MKQVIVLESKGLFGGAFESVSLLIRNIGHKVDLIVPKSSSEDYVSKRMLKSTYGGNVENVYEFYLPYSVENTIACEAYDAYNMKRSYRLFQAHKKELYVFLDKKHYDHIHLNGMGLYPVLNRKFPMTLHMRQVFNGGRYEKEKRMFFLRQSRAVIYIDQAAYKPFQKMRKDHLILFDPVDQTGINSISEPDILNKYHIDKNCTIFTMAGTISEGKGVGFVIQAYQDYCKVNTFPSKLLIAGDGVAAYRKKCREIADNNPDILFLGRLSRQEMQEIYKISDYILRGESEPVIGMTVWEALYSGDGLVIQGDDNIRQEIIKGMGACNNNIFTYEPRNAESLVKALLKAEGKKSAHTGESSAKKHADTFNRFIEEVIKIK